MRPRLVIKINRPEISRIDGRFPISDELKTIRLVTLDVLQRIALIPTTKICDFERPYSGTALKSFLTLPAGSEQFLVITPGRPNFFSIVASVAELGLAVPAVCQNSFVAL